MKTPSTSSLAFTRKQNKSNRAYAQYTEIRKALWNYEETKTRITRNWDCDATADQKNAWVKEFMEAEDKAMKLIRTGLGISW